MSCAAVEAVGMMCESTLSDGGYEFRCPQCKHELEFFVIRHILSSVKSQTELRRDFDRVNANFVNQRQREMRRSDDCTRDYLTDSGNSFAIVPFIPSRRRQCETKRTRKALTRGRTDFSGIVRQVTLYFRMVLSNEFALKVK